MKRHLLPFLALVGCATPSGTGPAPEEARPPASTAPALPQEVRLADLRQLTFGGENAEAYWSFDGKQLSLQARLEGMGCDRIFRMAMDPGSAAPALTPVSSGRGATTCAHFLPGDQELIYASTHLGGEACPPRPDHSMGYVWALYDTYDIFLSRADGSGEVTRLTETPGYDAEGTVCAKDGSILFTSVRDGDLELYRMDRDGKNVRRLTHTPGYDGGAFFNADCSKIVWRASRPRPGKELEDYQALLARGLVRPTKLELYVANADGSEARQVTWLNAAAFAPFFHPNGRRILFSSNHGDPKGREFDIWAVDLDGANLERITHAPGFDGFPMFSPDGKWLVFSSNRATAPGRNDTNVFLARWVDDATPASVAETATERIKRDVAFLAAPEREGRGIGTAGLEAAGRHIEARFQELGLKPAGDAGSFRQVFPVTTAVKPGAGTEVKLGGTVLPGDAYTVLGFSAQAVAQGPLVLAGYGIVEPSLKVDDYAKRSVKGKIAVVRRFVPDTAAFSDTDKQRRFGDLRYKAWAAAQRGAKALLVVDWPEAPTPPVKDWTPPPEASLPGLSPEGPGDAGIPVVVVKRAALEPLMAALEKGQRVDARVDVRLDFEKRDAFNVAALLEAGEGKLPGAIVIGAHYDHLGLGGRYSLTPDRSEPHGGADDNASGVAGLLEIARTLAGQRERLKRDVLFVAFSGEETGVLGSTYFTRQRGDAGMKGIAAMLNLDMVGRLRAGGLTVLGAESAAEWGPLITAACEKARVPCTSSGDGYGPSDHSPFYAAGVPVLHFFTGTHSDYHKPSDTVETLNVAGTARVADIVSAVALALDGQTALTYRKVPSPAPRGDLRSFNASLGTVPDYAGPPDGRKGMLLAGVRAGGAAEHAGMKRGDVLVRLGKHVIGGVEDLMFVLNASKPGETVTAVVVRDGKEVPLEVTFQESRRPR
ncbi:M20/M25/M40 family metallo-hydrolase [Pyxidicoccus fallax]|uniref:M20/M25/M40 family metallo-hydrolase n=1 Tax=Pyxidicoccus fallax TaxID=394095 RepID=A0A848LPR9_9BACT|nr:M20/M25/M40 family metallo-hydrolase [Pyxidicoccus fallax]NMO19650.1 M20/M25/M40 family metallo-hydrolase [Pyxidicoccus fallax]NPC80446.1 M20/M25/M40 family metallo-hydrolase [Pyxidicoccus fallax]